MNLLRQIRRTVEKLLAKSLSSKQQNTLSLLVAGTIESGRAGIAAIGRAVPSETSDKHRIKQVDRFVGNRLVDVDKISESLLRSLATGKKHLFLATDWSEFGSLSVLTTAVIAGKRAIPVYWTVIDTEQQRQRAVESGHFEAVHALLPPGVEAVFLADRGFDGGDRIAHLAKFTHFIIRLSRGFVYQAQDTDEWRNINDYSIKRRRKYDLGRVRYTRNHGTACRIVITHDEMQDEPWILATNLAVEPREVIKLYGRRFQIEESFKDLKDIRNGFQLSGYKMKSTERLRRLLAVVIFGYLCLTVVGVHGEAEGLHRPMQVNSRTSKRELALWRVGKALLRRAAARLDDIIDIFLPSLALA
jgi:hypothetical protein